MAEAESNDMTEAATAAKTVDNFSHGNGVAIMFKMLHLNSEENKNLLFSPFVFHASLIYMYSISTETTATYLANFLGMSNLKSEKLIALYNQMMASMLEDDLFMHSLVVIDMGNMVKDGFVLHTERFRNIDQVVFDFEKANLLYKYMEHAIPKKVPGHFKGRAGAAYAPVRIPMTKHSMGLYCVVHFQGKFETAFYDKNAFKGNFFSITNQKISTDMFRGTKMMRHVEIETMQAKIVEVPLRNDSSYFLYVILPNDVKSFVETEYALSATSWALILSKTAPTVVEYTLPKMKATAMVELATPMQTEQPGAIVLNRFGTMCDRDVAFRFCYQSCNIEFIGVNKPYSLEQDAQLVATNNDATLEEIMSKKENFVADHPFFFVIKKLDSTDNKLKTIIAGKFLKPK